MGNLKDKARKFLYKNRRYEVVKQGELNILVETENSKARRTARRENLYMFLTCVSAVAAVIAAIFAALAYINA